MPLLFACQFPFGKKKGAEQAVFDAKNPCVVLALPASGPYASVAAKIRRGADLAVQELKKLDSNVRLENINTEAADWIARLEALPPVCAVVGGPLQDKAYSAAKSTGVLERRVFYTFVPNLEANDEGNLAWRFFPGPQDQVEALIKFGADRLNVRAYGAFYPDDNYGRRMTQVFEQTLAKRHMPLVKTSYNPQAPATWSKAAATLINPVMGEDGKTPIPQTAFEAVFLPDSWKHVDTLITALLYNGENRLILMGPTLWEHSLAAKPVANAGKYALAVFPAAWNPARAPKALQGGNNDFWVALGYDFMNFAVNTAQASRGPAAEVTKRSQRAAAVVRALAPLHYSDAGIASLDMFLFQVGPSGMQPLEMERFRSAQAAANEAAALRMQNSANRIEEPEEPEPVAMPVSAQPVVAPAPAPPVPGSPNLGTTPRPSYKLRLPGSK